MTNNRGAALGREPPDRRRSPRRGSKQHTLHDTPRSCVAPRTDVPEASINGTGPPCVHTDRTNSAGREGTISATRPNRRTRASTIGGKRVARKRTEDTALPAEKSCSYSVTEPISRHSCGATS